MTSVLQRKGSSLCFTANSTGPWLKSWNKTWYIYQPLPKTITELIFLALWARERDIIWCKFMIDEGLVWEMQRAKASKEVMIIEGLISKMQRAKKSQEWLTQHIAFTANVGKSFLALLHSLSLHARHKDKLH